MFETIVALATAPLKSAIAVIRMSGYDCFLILNKIFNKDICEDLSNKKRRVFHGYIVDEQKIIDEVVLIRYVQPHSYTGENSIEIMCHGSMLIANQIIELLLKNGARMATNGEFTSRAFLNGKMDLIQAEAVNDLINASTNEAKEISMYALSGETSNKFYPLRVKLGEMMAKIEVNIDYPEYEDIEEVSREYLLKNVIELINEIESIVSIGENNKYLNRGVNVAIVGKPNVGKSSLLNALIREDKAIVTDIAGTTRDIVEGEINISGVLVRFLDTAGFHESDDLIENIGIKKTMEAINKADLILYLIYGEEKDNEFINQFMDKPFIVVHSKADLIENKKDNELYISTVNNDVDNLLKEIKNKLGLDKISLVPSLNNVRQLGLLKKINESLLIVKTDLENNEPIDLIANSLMIAYRSSLEILGEDNKNDLSDEIFSRFCVGK